MLKKILIVLAILTLLAVVVIAYAAKNMKPDKDQVLTFLKEHPETTAIKLVRNGELVVGNNLTKVMPLASTVKIVIAIEYAEQAALGLLNPDEKISLTELEQFYAKNTDGGAHPGWLKHVEDKISEETVSIREIAKGMILFSSNANTEWLCDRLGLDKINARVDSMGVASHTEIYNIVSALYVGKELFPDTKGDALEAKLKSLSTEDYIAATARIHDKLKTETEYRNDLGDLGMGIQRIWSDRLPAATVEDYVKIMTLINSRTYFGPETHSYLDEVMEYLLENPQNAEWLEHAGMKGGSTAFVLTKALYATDKKGNKTELAYFLDDLGIFENMKLQGSMNAFELAILSDEDYLTTVAERLK